MTDSSRYEYDWRRRLSHVNMTDSDLTKYDWRRRLRGLLKPRVTTRPSDVLQYRRTGTRYIMSISNDPPPEADLGMFSMFGRTGATQMGPPQEYRQILMTKKEKKVVSFSGKIGVTPSGAARVRAHTFL